MNWKDRTTQLVMLAAVLGVVLYIVHRSDLQRAEDMARWQATVQANNTAMLSAIENIKAEAKAAKTPEQKRDFVERETGIADIEVKPTDPKEPDAPPQLIVPAQPLTMYVAECATCKVKLATCEENLKATEQAVKGGSFWTRTKRAAKWIGFGVALGAAGYAAAHR